MDNKKYIDYSDEELIRIARIGNTMAVDILMEKYKGMVKNKAKTLFLIGGDHDDLIQEGMIGLYKAIRDFNETKDSSFSNFARLCISRQIYNAIKAQNRKKNLPLNHYISLYEPAFDKNTGEEKGANLVDIMYHNKDANPEELVIDKESTSVLEYSLLKRLSDFEKDVIRLYLSGFKYQQIAEILGKEPKSVDNAIQRIKMKLNQVLQEL